MKIGIAGPVSLHLLSNHVENGDVMPAGYEFPYLATLAEEYMRRGHQVVFFTLDPQTKNPTSYLGSTLRIHIGRFRRPRERVRDFFYVERRDLMAAMRADPCDVLHAHWTYEFALAALSVKQPCLVTAHDAPLNILRYDHSPYRVLRTMMVLRVLYLTHFLTAVSPYVSNHLKNVLRYRRYLSVIPNGLPGPFFKLRQRRWTGDRVVFATIATGWTKIKNLETLLRAFSLVRKAFQTTELWLIGGDLGPNEKAESWAISNNLQTGVRFVGKTDYRELLPMLSKAVDVLVHPSFEEACPMSVLEGLALGLPVIGGEGSGGVPYVLGYGDAGKLVNVHSVNELANAMLDFALTPKLRNDYGERGYNHALQHFVLENIADEYFKLYQQLG